MDFSAHQIYCIILGLWSGIAGIVALALNDKSQCAESHQTLMVLGAGLAAFSVIYFINCVPWGSFWWVKSQYFPFLVYSSAIFVFVLDCMLIDDMARGNQDGDCSGGRGTPRLFIIGWVAPFALTVCVFSLGPKEDDFYRPVDAEFQLVL